MSQTLHKKFSRTEYIKNLLIKQNGLKRCEYCKYHWGNYNNLNKASLNFFKEKCKYCNERLFSAKIKVKDSWHHDNFKPLYDWEEIQEGENNE